MQYQQTVFCQVIFSKAEGIFNVDFRMLSDKYFYEQDKW